MRVLCGGEDGVMGVYGGELLPDTRSDAEHRLVRIDAIYSYPHQHAIITRCIFERLPLPYGAVVRTAVIDTDPRPGAADAAEYDDMLRIAHKLHMDELIAAGDWEAYRVLKLRGALVTGVSGRYCRR